MLIERPENPQGRHVSMLRNHLGGISQTLFGALLESAQTTVSQWESPEKRDELLPPLLAQRLLEVWDCFPTPPRCSYTEMMARVAAHRMGKAPSAPSADEGALIKLVPEKPGPVEAPELYWAPGGKLPSTRGQASNSAAAVVGPKAPEGLEGGPDGPRPNGAVAQQQRREVIRVQLSLSAISILLCVWARARGAASRQRSPFGRRWATVASLLLLVIPMACLQGHRGTSLGETDDALFVGAHRVGQKTPTERYIPKDPLPGQKRAPCDPESGESTVNDNCWVFILGMKPPCGKLFRYEDKCARPVAADPKAPVGDSIVSCTLR